MKNKVTKCPVCDSDTINGECPHCAAAAAHKYLCIYTERSDGDGEFVACLDTEIVDDSVVEAFKLEWKNVLGEDYIEHYEGDVSDIVVLLERKV